MSSKQVARIVLVAVLSLATTGGSAYAQNIYGALVGNVTDSSGGAIPGATVTATPTETNLTREVVTNESGAYTIPNIPSGTYQVVVTVPGFQTFTARDIAVTNRDVRVDARLGLGTLEEALTVTATAAILQTENAAVQHIANSKQLQTLPTLQIRAEVFNVSNTPHFGNPNANMSNVVFNTDGSIRSLGGVGSITSPDRTGRQYDEREWRLGARFEFSIDVDDRRWMIADQMEGS